MINKLETIYSADNKYCYFQMAGFYKLRPTPYTYGEKIVKPFRIWKSVNIFIQKSFRILTSFQRLKNRE